MDITLCIVDLLWRSQEAAMTINEIAKQLKGTYSYINRVVLRLVKEDIIIKKTVGHAFLCSLNKTSEKTKALLLLAEINKKQDYYKKHQKLGLLFKDFLKELPSSVVSVVLFGSYAKETFTSDSDIDILVLTISPTDITKPIRKIYSLHGKNISPLTFTQKEFQHRRNEPIIMEIIKHHIVLHGTEQFIQEVY